MKHCKDCNEFMCGQSGTDAISQFCGTERQDNDTAKPKGEETTKLRESGEGGMALRPEQKAAEIINELCQTYVLNPETRYQLALIMAEEALREKAARENPRRLEEWGEEYGDCLWWKFPIAEPPYSGSPLDAAWPEYHTHFTKICYPHEPKEEPKQGEPPETP